MVQQAFWDFVWLEVSHINESILLNSNEFLHFCSRTYLAFTNVLTFYRAFSRRRVSGMLNWHQLRLLEVLQICLNKAEAGSQQWRNAQESLLSLEKRIAAKSSSVTSHSPAASHVTKREVPKKLSPSSHKGSKFSDSGPGASSPLQRFPARTASVGSADSSKTSKNSSNGNLAPATSTGRLVNKMAGRIGDTPVIGAGTYANEFCAVSATGIGEAIIRGTVARDMAAIMEFKGLSLKEAADCVVHECTPKGAVGFLKCSWCIDASAATGITGWFHGTAAGVLQACCSKPSKVQVSGFVVNAGPVQQGKGWCSLLPFEMETRHFQLHQNYVGGVLVKTCDLKEQHRSHLLLQQMTPLV
ncbi:hypothetical protein KIW84_054479 [Lathyrus oleraceus]|uniref:beta-aspartyl-peptidase n=1 Tax=Pisum sativum TaxID=3888 RepID=A0A9D4WVF6_PEA|nr:hypothetical protein KIW84_054479 [Pisum sativum]